MLYWRVPRLIEELRIAHGDGSYIKFLKTLSKASLIVLDDIEWFIPAMFNIRGKEAFDKHIENECFVGRPTITTDRLTEENDVVVAEGTVKSELAAGGFVFLHYCDVFEMRGGKIRKLRKRSFLTVSAETARIDAEGIEHHVSAETLEAFRRAMTKDG